MGYHCVVLAKQVPDTQRITGQVMNDDGTVNRAALPAIFNPEDLNALEMALRIKDRFGGRVTVITMGLPAAARFCGMPSTAGRTMPSWSPIRVPPPVIPWRPATS